MNSNPEKKVSGKKPRTGVVEPGFEGATPRNRGIGMLIITAYGVFAVSAFARAFYQIVPFPQEDKVQFADAPLALSLSAFAAVVYIIATLALARTSPTAWRVAFVAVLVEMAGVIGVGFWTLVQPELFEVATVWGGFGRDYGYIPLLLPFIGLFWLLKHR
ncbi:hypothetical protein [Nesterenkonia alba]|uniref:hypothetical protein n=1 Tax=Nesterenkonia alba TaxID=515814 RepID=UPI0003B748E9|nr:hypothetical protein [Nesterenkonia alba]